MLSNFFPRRSQSLTPCNSFALRTRATVFLGAWNGEELVGTVGTQLLREDRLEIGYWVGTRYQGLGYAYDATSAVIAELTRSYHELEITA